MEMHAKGIAVFAEIKQFGANDHDALIPFALDIVSLFVMDGCEDFS